MLLQSIDWIRSVMLARLRGSRDLVGLDLSQRQPIWRIINAVARECHKLAVDFVAWSVNVIPTTATGLWLRRWAAAYGVTPIVATTWEGYVTLYADTGLTPAFAAGRELSFSGDSTTYQTTIPVAAGDWSGPGGSVTVAAESITTGTVANKDSGTALTVVTPPAGVLADALMGSTTTAALDNETEPLLQVRLGNRLAGMPNGENVAQYRQWALEAIASNYGGHSNEAVDAAVYPRWDDVAGARGTVTVVLFGPALPLADERIVSASCVTDVAAYIEQKTKKPIGSDLTVEATVPAYHAFGYEVEVRPKPGYEPDWYSPAPAATVVSTTPASRRVDLDTDMTPYIDVGDRIAFFCGVQDTTEQEIVQEVGAPGGGGALGYVILREWPEAGDPQNATDVLPGGPLWQPAHDAIVAVHEALGPASSSTVGIDRWPIEEFERPSALNFSTLHRVLDNLTGVESCAWTQPTADIARVEPQADPITITCLVPSVTITFPGP